MMKGSVTLLFLLGLGAMVACSSPNKTLACSNLSEMIFDYFIDKIFTSLSERKMPDYTSASISLTNVSSWNLASVRRACPVSVNETSCGNFAENFDFSICLRGVDIRLSGSMLYVFMGTVYGPDFVTLNIPYLEIVTAGSINLKKENVTISDVAISFKKGIKLDISGFGLLARWQRWIRWSLNAAVLPMAADAFSNDLKGMVQQRLNDLKMVYLSLMKQYHFG